MKISFNDAYKEWRNKARRYRPQSIVRMAMEVLHEEAKSPIEDLKRIPWHVLLAVKWVCQDGMANDKTGADITRAQFDMLRQALWDFPERVDLGMRDSLPIHLFLRQLLRPQIAFQRQFAPGLLREPGMLAQLSDGHPLRNLFETKVRIGINDFLDLTFASLAAVGSGKRSFSLEYFTSMRKAYRDDVIIRFVQSISMSYPDLRDFFRGLPGKDRRVASELFEFPAVSRYPLLRTGDLLECWHPAVFYRGLEGIVHNILREEGQTYIDRFSKLFEEHVTSEAKRVSAPFLDEKDLRALLPLGAKVPDGLLSFPECNVFIESKAGLFEEPVMTVGHSEFFADRTRALRTAVGQGWAASLGARSETRAPKNVLNAPVDYLLIVTNKELSASNGRKLESMYPPDTFERCGTPSPFLPLSNVYVLSIDDYERLIGGVIASEITLPQFLDGCVKADSDPMTSLLYFEQHLSRAKVTMHHSRLCMATLETVDARVTNALSQ